MVWRAIEGNPALTTLVIGAVTAGCAAMRHIGLNDETHWVELGRYSPIDLCDRCLCLELWRDSILASRATLQLLINIVVVTLDSPPEVGAPQAWLSEMARTWAETEEVTVLTGMQNYPTATSPPEYPAADHMVVVIEGFPGDLSARGVSAHKVSNDHRRVDLDRFQGLVHRTPQACDG